MNVRENVFTEFCEANYSYNSIRKVIEVQSPDQFWKMSRRVHIFYSNSRGKEKNLLVIPIFLCGNVAYLLYNFPLGKIFNLVG